jgi:hypothetical protein
MDDKHKEALSKANRGNNHSSRKNREKNKLFKHMINEVVSANDYEKALKVVESLVQKAEEGDLRATEIILDRIDGKVVQGNTIDGEINHNVNRPLRVITGIPDSDGRDYVDLIPTPDGGRRPVTDEEYKTLRVTPEQAKQMDEEGWEGTTIEFIEPQPRDADGNKIVQEDTDKY